ncbi:MAG: hypothetical protein J0L97_08305 [Alphaproteobacteria bacterium]|nr:hypothetical protein [Alphaproteobacteria bacterium]
MTSAKTLLDLIKSIVPDNINLFSADGEKAVNNLPLGYKSYYIGNAAKEFKTVLSAELESTDTYFVSRKSIFDTTDLISSSTNVFPENIRAKLPSETITDFQEAGRCLAFELSTACGFHLVRAIESVIHKYYEHITSGQKLQLKPSERNWGSYIKKLQDANADASVLSVLDHIRSLHRNPLMHPDDVLTSDEALSLWGIVQSAIIAMYKKMETKVVNLPLPQKKTSP